MTEYLRLCVLILRRIYHGSTKRRTSKTRKNKRRTHFKISVPGMTECPNCGEYKLSHRVCKTVVLTMVKKSFLNNLYLFKRWNTNSL